MFRIQLAMIIVKATLSRGNERLSITCAVVGLLSGTLVLNFCRSFDKRISSHQMASKDLAKYQQLLRECSLEPALAYHPTIKITSTLIPLPNSSKLVSRHVPFQIPDMLP